ncbi:MAG TPA: hypothetical protein VHO24_10505 [Opitutaceae bacterium]|nr:hypothetical protein [Opitutaceae bacterium]
MNVSANLGHALLALAALGAGFIALPLRAETILVAPTEPDSGALIRFAAPWVQNPRFGFAPVRVTIENRAPVERTWDVQFQSGMRNFSSGVLNSEHTITVPAGHTREVWVFVPVAEPGVNMGPGSTFAAAALPVGTSGSSIAPVITPLPSGGRKVTRVVNNRDGSTTTIETEIDIVAGSITTTTTKAPGVVSTQARFFPLKRGTAVTITIDPDTGAVGVPRARPATGNNPARVTFLTTKSGGRRPPRPVPGTPGGAPISMIGPVSMMALTAEVAGPGVRSNGRVNFPGSSSSNGMRPFAVSSSLEAVFRSRLASLVSGAPNISTMDPAQLPADWRVWSSFSGVLLTTDEYAALDVARRSALRGWVALGGQLCLSPGASAAPAGSGELTEKLGAGVIVTLAEPLAAASPAAPASPGSPSASDTEKQRRATMEAEIAARRAARAAGLPIPKPASTTAPAPSPAPEDLFPLGRDVKLFESTNGLPDQSAFELDPLRPLAEQVKEGQAESSWLALFLVVFAIVVGPVNLFVFAPSHKRHRLFLTTPLIALAASILLALTILVQDGIGGTGMRQTLVVLLPGDNQTAVFQEQAARTGFLLGRAFALPEDVQLTSLPLHEPTWGGPETTFLREGSRVGGDWFRNRARQAHLLQRLVPTRGRVEHVGTDPGGAPIVQSSLGTTLQDFVCLGDAGETWKTAELAPGRRVTLERGGTWLGSASGPLDPGGSLRFKQVFDAATQNVPDRWCARGTPSELAPIPTLESMRWQDGAVIYTGSLETTAAAGAAAEPAAKTEGQP